MSASKDAPANGDKVQWKAEKTKRNDESQCGLYWSWITCYPNLSSSISFHCSSSFGYSSLRHPCPYECSEIINCRVFTICSLHCSSNEPHLQKYISRLPYSFRLVVFSWQDHLLRIRQSPDYLLSNDNHCYYFNSLVNKINGNGNRTSSNGSVWTRRSSGSLVGTNRLKKVRISVCIVFSSHQDCSKNVTHSSSQMFSRPSERAREHCEMRSALNFWKALVHSLFCYGICDPTNSNTNFLTTPSVVSDRRFFIEVSACSTLSSFALSQSSAKIQYDHSNMIITCCGVGRFTHRRQDCVRIGETVELLNLFFWFPIIIAAQYLNGKWGFMVVRITAQYGSLRKVFHRRLHRELK